MDVERGSLESPQRSLRHPCRGTKPELTTQSSKALFCTFYMIAMVMRLVHASRATANFCVFCADSVYRIADGPGTCSHLLLPCKVQFSHDMLACVPRLRDDCGLLTIVWCSWRGILCFTVFSIAAITDYADGYVCMYFVW
jgi:phosphatidylglycerophosphate synthase